MRGGNFGGLEALRGPSLPVLVVSLFLGGDMRCAVKGVGMGLSPIACAEGLVCVERCWMDSRW